jgi:hypothetical protein
MKKRERATHTVTFMHRAGHEPSNRNSLQDLVDKMDEYDAKNAGLTLDQWKSVAEYEQIGLAEDHQDRRFAERETLEEYRARQRASIEAGGLKKEYGFPQWLRDQYAKERPAEVVVEYLDLLTAGATAAGEALQEIIGKIYSRTGRGWVPGLPPAYREPFEMTFAEARKRLLEEIDRAGLGEFFREAEAQQRERANH